MSRHTTIENSGISNINTKFKKIFGVNYSIASNLINDIAQLEKVEENVPTRFTNQRVQREENSEQYATQIVSDFLELSEEHKENNKHDFYYCKISQIELLQKAPPEVSNLLKNFSNNNAENFSKSKNPHLNNLAANFYLHGIGVDKNRLKALTLLEKGNETNHKPSQGKLESHHLHTNSFYDALALFNKQENTPLDINRSPSDLYWISESYDAATFVNVMEETSCFSNASLKYCCLASDAGP